MIQVLVQGAGSIVDPGFFPGGVNNVDPVFLSSSDYSDTEVSGTGLINEKYLMNLPGTGSDYSDTVSSLGGAGNIDWRKMFQQSANDGSDYIVNGVNGETDEAALMY